MTGKIFLSCGHEDERKPTGWGLYVIEEDVDGVSLVSSSYCTDCLCRWIKDGHDNIYLSFDEAWEAAFGQEK